MTRPPKKMRNYISRQLTILCIDDDKDGGAVRKAILESAGHRVLICDRGCLGLELAHRRRIDLVLVDYELPDINGFSVAALLRAIRPAMRIVMLSGRELDASMAATGILDDYMAKGTPVEEFLRVAGEKAKPRGRLAR